MFVKASTLCKLIIWADNDEVIADPCSLKSGVMTAMIDSIMGQNQKEIRVSSASTEEEESMNSMD